MLMKQSLYLPVLQAQHDQLQCCFAGEQRSQQSVECGVLLPCLPSLVLGPSGRPPLSHHSPTIGSQDDLEREICSIVYALVLL